MIFCIITETLTNILVMTQKIWTLQPFCQGLRKKKIFLTQLRLKSNLLKHHLKQEVPIHWNLTCYTLEQLLEQEKAVQDSAGQGMRTKKKKKKKMIFLNVYSVETDKLWGLSPLRSHCWPSLGWTRHSSAMQVSVSPGQIDAHLIRSQENTPKFQAQACLP